MVTTTQDPRETVDLEGIAEGLRPLLAHEVAAKWEIGDYLIKNNHLSPGQMKRLAQLVKREQSTLEAYKKVSATFLPSRRHPELDLAWGVFKQLARVNDEEWQDDYIRFNPNTTSHQAEKAANARLIKDKPSRPPRQKYTDRASVPGVEVDLEVTGNDLAYGQAVLSGNIQKAELVFSKAHDKWRVDFTLKPEPKNDGNE